MKSRRMNVNISVGEHLFEEIVYPAKDEKRLGKLVVSLLEAYRVDEYVRAFIDGDLEDKNAQANSELGDLLKGMNDSLNESEFHLRSAESTISSGSEAFTEGAPRVQTESTDDRMDRIENVVEGIGEAINKLLSGVSEGKVDLGDMKSEPAQEDVKTRVSEPVFEDVVVEDEGVEDGLSSEPVMVDDGFLDDYESSDLDEELDDEEGDESPPAANDLLARLSKNVNKGGL